MAADISPYFGTGQVRALQQARDAEVPAFRDQPGAVIHARTFSSDDPDALGWDRLRDVFLREGRVTLRGVGPEQLEQARDVLGGLHPVEHAWDLFMADAEDLCRACEPIAEVPVPQGLRLTPHADLTDALVRDVQAFLAEHGVSPFSVNALTGRLFPARLCVLRHDDGGIAAASFAAMTHNAHSPFHGVAWVGLVAVDPVLRGLGLGKWIDAVGNLAAVNELGARATMEFVDRDNAASRAMLESCGLGQVADRSVVMFSRSEDRLTR